MQRFQSSPPVSEYIRRVLERYSHIRRAAKQATIASLERPDFQADRVQKWAQADAIEVSDIGTTPEKALNPYFLANGRTC